jgi:hypothetical protein
MIWTRIIVQPINFSFAGYSVVATENETLKVTSIEKTDSRKVSADLSATLPGSETQKITVAPSNERTVKSTSDISAPYEKLGIDIMPFFLRIIRESETGTDAVGNTRLALTIVTDPDMIWNETPPLPAATFPAISQNQHRQDDKPIELLVRHFEEKATDKPPKPMLDLLPQVWVPHCPLRARVWMLYEKREVRSGREFYEEGKQIVKLMRHAEDKQDIDIMSADEVSPAVWTLMRCAGGRCQDLMASLVTGPEWAARKLVFTDYSIAIRLAHWLKTHPGNSPDPRYHFDNKPEESIKPYKITGNNCVSIMKKYLDHVARKRQMSRPHIRHG